MYSLYSFCFPLLFTYSVELKRGYNKPYTAAISLRSSIELKRGYVKPYTAAVSLQNRVGLNVGHADQTLHTKPPLKILFLKP